MHIILDWVMNCRSSLLLTWRHSTAACCRSACQLCSLMHHSHVFTFQTPLGADEFEPETSNSSCYWSGMGAEIFWWLHKPLLLSPRLPGVQILSIFLSSAKGPCRSKFRVWARCWVWARCLIWAANVRIPHLNRNRLTTGYLGGSPPTFGHRCWPYSWSYSVQS